MRSGLKGFLVGIACLLVIIFFGLIIYFSATPSGREAWNGYMEKLQKADDRSLYETKKEVENTCRAMIASYNSDKLIYEQYKDYAQDTEQKGWSDAAKIRANQTASNYNNYVLKNSYVWKENVPDDIYMNLPYLS